MRYGLTTLVILAFGLALSSTTADARTRRVTGTGTTTVTSRVITSSRQEGNYTIAAVSVTAVSTGILSGTIEAEETAIVHPDGAITITGVNRLIGSVDGTPGTLVIQERARIETSGRARSKFQIVEGTDALQAVRGRGSIQFKGDNGTYSVTLEFAATDRDELEPCAD